LVANIDKQNNVSVTTAGTDTGDTGKTGTRSNDVHSSANNNNHCCCDCFHRQRIRSTEGHYSNTQRCTEIGTKYARTPLSSSLFVSLITSLIFVSVIVPLPSPSLFRTVSKDDGLYVPPPMDLDATMDSTNNTVPMFTFGSVTKRLDEITAEEQQNMSSEDFEVRASLFFFLFLSLHLSLSLSLSPLQRFHQLFVSVFGDD
jgi:hypothetical protein